MEPFAAYGGGVTSGKWDGISKQIAFSDEDETLLQRGSKFRITKIEKANGKWYIDLDLIGQEP